LKEAIIALNGEERGLVNNVCALSDVAPSYAPENQALISISVLGLHQGVRFERTVLCELQQWFGEQVQSWELLHTDQIRRALPEQGPDQGSGKQDAFLRQDGILICGDHCTSASIEGALTSGLRTAESIIQENSDSRRQ
tara:strand:+ start:57 stop:473 length:417 start_codon:yes stop_codon:yes gene_type:complete